MPRSIVLGNGNILAALDEHLQLRDFYYPHVGMEDQTTYGNFHRVGFFVNDRFSWINDSSWQINAGYAKDSLVGDCTAVNHHLQIKVRFEDFVYNSYDIFCRRLTITNLAPHPQEVRVFFHHDLHIYGDKTKDTAQYEPEMNAVLHYRGKRYFLINGLWDNGVGMDQFTIGKSKYNGKEGTFRDAEDGNLQGNPIEQGSVDSTVGFRNNIESGQSAILNQWIVAGKKYEEICEANHRIIEFTPKKIYDHTLLYWQNWSHQKQKKFDGLPPEIEQLYRRSLLIIRTQIDNGGAIIASNDTDIMATNRDNYTYMWPRDGAHVAMALSEAGYEDFVRKFFLFCRRILTREGYLLHKYNPDGSLGSSWHPKYKNEEIQLPIQEDESALVLVALEKYLKCFSNLDVVHGLFDDLVIKIGNWLCEFVDKKTGLPLPSYDLWEQDRGVSTYTVACTIAGIRAARHLSLATGHQKSAADFLMESEKMKRAMLENMFSIAEGRFLKSVQVNNGLITDHDNTVDASLAFIWKLGILPIDDPRVKSTMAAIDLHLSIHNGVGGIARFPHDSYHFDYFTTNHDIFPGNPWIITTLWKAEYLIETAKTRADLDLAIELIQWVAARANSAGILPEQVHPKTGKPLSVAPLTWSHSTFVSTTHALLVKMREIL